MMKPQDVLVLLKLAAHPDARWTYVSLGRDVGLSASEAHASVRRSLEAGLLRPTDKRPMASPLREFLVHGLRYVFPGVLTSVTRGVPTTVSAPELAAHFVAPTLPFVWPSPKGTVRGQGLRPIHPSAPAAALSDARLHTLLALADLCRVGTARERAFADETLRRELGA